MLKIAYIASENAPGKAKRLTAKQKLHQEALVSLAARKIHDRAQARKKFAREWAEIERLEKQLNIN